MTDAERETSVKASARHARDSKGHRHLWAFGAVILVGLGVFLAAWLIDRAEKDRQIAQLVGVVEVLSDQITGLGEVPEAAPPPDAPPVPVATDDAIRAQLLAYFAEHPQAQPPTVAEVTSIVARIYRDNPPAAGKRGKTGEPGGGATAGQVAASVADYCAAERCQGPQGVQGPGPTAEQVLTAVEAYCAERNGCQGPKGETGADGPRGDSVAGHRFERIDGDCRSVTTLERADGSTYEINADAGEAACAGPDPPN